MRLHAFAGFAQAMDGEAAVVQGLAQAMPGAGHDQLAEEGRVRMGGHVPAANRAIDVRRHLQVEHVHRAPAPGHQCAQGVGTVDQGESERLVWGGLLRFAVQLQRTGRHHAAKADIGDVAHTLQGHQHQHQHVRASSLCILRPAHHHSPGQHARLEAQRLQQQQKQPVELKAITAAPLAQQLVLHRTRVDGHGGVKHR